MAEAQGTPEAPAPDPSPTVDDVVGRLRAAGCVFAEDEAVLLRSTASGEALERLLDRRVSGESLEHLLGWVEFAGLRLAVGPGVFVPRRRTELLARVATEHASGRPHPVVVELCCGCAPVATAVAAAVQDAEVHASDVAPAALVHARRNLDPQGGRVHGGDLDGGLPRDLQGRVDVLVANAPYVPTGALATMPPEARLHEPRRALDGGHDGLDLLRRVLDAAPRWLAPDGVCVVEASAAQAARLGEHAWGLGLRAHVVEDPSVDGLAVVLTRAHDGRDGAAAGATSA